MRVYFFVIYSVMVSLVYAGGGWTKKKGTGYYKVSQWWVVSSKHYTSNGEIAPNVTMGIFNTSLYGEYGITNRITATLYFPFFSRTYQNEQVSGTTGMVISPGEAINSIGDMNIAATYGISKPGSKYAFSGTLLMGLPTGNDAGGSEGSLQTGDGEFNQMVRFDLSRSFSLGKVGAYANIYTGFNNRTKKFSDEFRAGGEVGISVSNSKLWGIVRLDVVESLQNGSSLTEDGDGASIFSNNTEFISYTYEVAYYVTKKFGVSASYGGALSAKLIYASPSYSVGVFLDLK